MKTIRISDQAHEDLLICHAMLRTKTMPDATGTALAFYRKKLEDERRKKSEQPVEKRD